MSGTANITARRLFDGETMHENATLVIEDGLVAEIVPADRAQAGENGPGFTTGMVVPGFVDLQVNGGGGYLLNDDPSVETIREICAAHIRLGTTSILPTLITDGVDKVRATIDAAIAAHRAEVPGFLGLHLEGPHLSITRKGAHYAALMREMSSQDMKLLIDAAAQLPHLMVTLAPEVVSAEQIGALARAGVVVSLGHSDCSAAVALEAAEAGASCVTHLFNAMSPLSHREPGLVGAALESGKLSAGLIADGYHVDPIAIRVALASKRRPGHLFLVSDAMSVTGSDLTSFTLASQKIFRRDGRLTQEDGTLAGADLDMRMAVKFMVETVGLGVEETLRMATGYPAACMRGSARAGHLKPGSPADFIHLSDAFDLEGVWLRGGAVQNLNPRPELSPSA
ncbi:N-acetylglucosamine-6-phosphate deacetylase [Mesorhizobium sp. Z1-4]|uniref:N-acetylglucosamine-6-phosphate deacetylase n=1 Tax=Mesorhizobium sp. Z1-4 TaxID=2448478 RepID=UPI000FDC3FAD|nr:N-acetylglucosamine-6-phosphate deacetylase [Mesorhizobium sp. Z1-4]